ARCTEAGLTSRQAAKAAGARRQGRPRSSTKQRERIDQRGPPRMPGAAGRLIQDSKLSPGPGVIIDEAGAGGDAAEQDHGAGGRVIGHRRPPPGSWLGRRGLAGPGRTVPGPRVIESAAARLVEPAEEGHGPGGRVVGYRRGLAWSRGGGRGLLGPGRTVPGPRVVERPEAAVAAAAAQDHGAGSRVIGHRRKTPGRRAGGRVLLGPGGPVPRPGTAEAAEDGGGAGGRHHSPGRGAHRPEARRVG